LVRPTAAGVDARRLWGRFFVIFFTGAVFTAPLVYSGFCADPNGIQVRRILLWNSRDYAWSDVKRVTVICYRSYGGRTYTDHESYVLALNDGSSVDLMTTPNSFYRGYNSLRHALHAVHPEFTSEIYFNCASDRMKALAAEIP